MSNCQHSAFKIFRAAVRDSDAYDRAFGLVDQAEIAVMGCIWQTSRNKDEFVKSGLSYLDQLPLLVEEKIEDFMQHEEPNSDLIEEIRGYLKKKDEVSRDDYIALLKNDWEARNFNDEN